MVSVHILFGKVQNPKNKIFDLISWEAWFYLYSDNMLKSHWQKDNKSSENAHILPTRHLKSFEKIQFQVLLYSMNCFNNWKRTVWGGQSEGWIFYFQQGIRPLAKIIQEYIPVLVILIGSSCHLRRTLHSRVRNDCKRSPSPRGKDRMGKCVWASMSSLVLLCLS